MYHFLLSISSPNIFYQTNSDMKKLTFFFLLVLCLSSCDLDKMRTIRTMSKRFCEELSNTNWNIAKISYESKDSVIENVGGFELKTTPSPQEANNRLSVVYRKGNNSQDLEFFMLKSQKYGEQISIVYLNSNSDSLKIAGSYEVRSRTTEQMVLHTEESVIGQGKITITLDKK